MNELHEIAANYAAEKTNEMMAKMIADAFADGYRLGYKDCEEDISVDRRDNKTEYVDLGLPSGTLWATDYERIDGRLLYLPYDKAIETNIPTEEQWRELYACKWAIKSDKLYCIGLNGNTISFIPTGYESVKDIIEIPEWSYLWLKNSKADGDAKVSAKMSWGKAYHVSELRMFRGYSLPVRFVKNQ